MATGSKTRENTSTVRLNVNLNEEAAAAIKQIADERDISVTEAIRRAISLFSYVDDETRKGRRLQTTNPDRSDVREIVLI
ncbi:ribbon-helix-helix protein, CopG family [Herbiconiux liangxiaofengii]|uniref:ribbon-helix-helix protein, CopG family n=1 Tax=Herbiconiux liangxiaofengii TaxID=3342795 RepID=UPI0035B88094